ncbi:Similar to hypothetical protein [Tuber melanosporum Mel28]; acc. no. XP_002836511 [Pyronema omphalodes CBS 100304]|uniref:Uncharacterized protein n=1 Tax=Pyronema omphalodes (strain CBS 100304) TaxID=1076935 RepID=U4LP68_PYROM|nr:Similar to hypothetical protein [Tuber melanosporum Mel28]; acc. no. XP_002836511 [Pyronema omphalodes CBS 100304]
MEVISQFFLWWTFGKGIGFDTGYVKLCHFCKVIVEMAAKVKVQFFSPKMGHNQHWCSSRTRTLSFMLHLHDKDHHGPGKNNQLHCRSLSGNGRQEQGSRAYILGVRSEGLEWWQDNFAHPNNTIGTFDDFRIDIVYNWFNNEWMYPFKDYALPRDVKTAKFPLIHRTERHVNITTKCDMYPIVSGQDGGPRNVKVLVNGTEQEHPWADKFKAANKTVYMNPNINPSTEERSGYDWDSTKYNCGPRCGYTFIYRFVHNTSIPTGDFINCTTKVSTVHNAKSGVAEHQVPDKVASRIASSIDSSSFMKYNQQHKMLYSFNVMDSSWNETNPPYSSARRGSFLLSRFAIGSLAMLDSTGPRLMAEGDAPYLGIKMDVNWQKVAGGVAGLLGVQLLAGIVTLWLSYPVVCKDSSYWSTARLLRLVVQRMEETGSMASGDQIAGLFKNRNMRYGVRTDKEGNNYLEILLDTPDFIPGSDTRYKKGAHFSKGYYE